VILSMERVPWLERTEISYAAYGLLREYSAYVGEVVDVPIPVEPIIERFLGIRLEYDDLEEMIGIPDVLGATWVEEKRMVIHSDLLGGAEGRFAFTCAPEVGHWVLHKELVMPYFRRAAGSRHIEPSILCRKRDTKLRGEWQANYFAACLLMPEEAVRCAYEDCFGPEPLVMHNSRSCFGPNSVVLDPALNTAKIIARYVIEAGEFSNVSREAMWYRLEELGLLVNLVLEVQPVHG